MRNKRLLNTVATDHDKSTSPLQFYSYFRINNTALSLSRFEIRTLTNYCWFSLFYCRAFCCFLLRILRLALPFRLGMFCLGSSCCGRGSVSSTCDMLKADRSHGLEAALPPLPRWPRRAWFDSDTRANEINCPHSLLNAIWKTKAIKVAEAWFPFDHCPVSNGFSMIITNFPEKVSK